MMFIKVLPLVLVCLVGYSLRRSGMLTSEDAQTIGKLLATLALPAIILKALITAVITPEVVYLPISALFIVLSLTIIGVFVSRWTQWERSTAGALVTTFPTFEGGAVGYPLMLLAFGEEGLSRIVLFDLAQAIFLLTVIYCLSAWFGRSEITAREVVYQLVKTPFFWAILIGLGLNLGGIQSAWLINFLDLVGSSFLLLILLLLTLEFQINTALVSRYCLISLLKTGCGLGLGWLAAEFFGLAGVERAAVLVGAALPPSMLTLLFAKENHLDTEFVAGFISVAIPLSLLLLTLLLNGM